MIISRKNSWDALTIRSASLAFQMIVTANQYGKIYLQGIITDFANIQPFWRTYLVLEGPTVTSIRELVVVTRVHLCPKVILWMCMDSIDRTRKKKERLDKRE
jgi:hypothetical protein